MRKIALLVTLVAVLAGQRNIAAVACAADDQLTAQKVLRAIKRGRNYLISKQQPDGSWGGKFESSYPTGVTSLCLLALMNAGMTPDDPAIARGLKWLRAVKEPAPKMTYEISLMIMALTTAKEGAKDKLRVFNLAQKLEKNQVKAGENAGGWGYGISIGGVDRSNTQFAILGLRDAAYYGIHVDRKVWQRAREYWLSQQSADGGWGYNKQQVNSSTGSMTVAGIASLTITSAFLHDQEETDAEGNPICCQPPESDEAMERAVQWLARNFSVHANPHGGTWWLYYLYGLERAGRLSGRRFFGTHDWYREGTRIILNRQSKRDGSWKGEGGFESDESVGTPLALLFLSKGLAPVLINKMKLGPRDPDNKELVIGELWNRHPKDVRNLVEHISTLPKWPKLLTWQTLDFDKAVANADNGLQEMLQAPILFVTSENDLSELMSDEHIALLRDYFTQGGFLFVSRGCKSNSFDQGMVQLVERLYPDGTTSLMPLAETHPVYRSEYLLNPETVKLFGVDVGCRTAIVYSPEDLGCLWDKRMAIDPPGRRQDLKTSIARSLRIGVNVVAYVTGREPPNKLDEQQLVDNDKDRDTLRGILSIAKLRHSGDWDAAPNAVKKLLTALEKSFGIVAGTKPNKLSASNPNLYRYTMLYMHGQRSFEISQEEIRNVRKYLENGGVLFVDACCGSPKFNASFRQLMKQMFPDIPLERIPVEHELFSQEIGHNLESVRRRSPLNDEGKGILKPVEHNGPPFLEGISIDGRFAVIYSKYDISCALEKQTSLSCIGYVPEDAAKIATNVVLYSVLQDMTPKTSPNQK